MEQSGLGLRVRGTRFIDDAGRQVLLHGINMVCKEESRHWVGDWSDEDFARLRRWGLNVIRLGMNWNALEPEPGVYDDEYIEAQRRLIRLAHQHQIRVFLDMHQDLYSTLFGNGAPAWATFTDGELYEPGEVWSNAYLFNKAVHKAFDHFWRNTPASDGVGIQDHFAQAWGHLAGKLHTEPNVIGYDLINEPFIGSGAEQAMVAVLAQYAELYAARYGETDPATDPAEMLAAWMDPERKEAALCLLEDAELFRQVVDAPSPVLQAFEAAALSALYRKVAAAIRETDAHGMLFLETNYFSNLGTRSMIEPVIGLDGIRDEQQVYAPHAYDLVTDTELAHTANDARLELILTRHEETRQRLQMPLLVGEWGAFYGSGDTGHVSLHIQRQLEKLLCSDAYWDYTPDMDRSPSFLGVRRGYPMAVAGKLKQYRYEHALGSFSMRWEEAGESEAPTIIYLPDIRHVAPGTVTLQPEGERYTVQPIEGSSAGYMLIPPVQRGNRSLIIVGKQPEG